MADAAVFVLAPHHHSMPLLAHLEELRKRIILSILGYSLVFSRAGLMLTVFSV